MDIKTRIKITDRLITRITRYLASIIILIGSL